MLILSACNSTLANCCTDYGLIPIIGTMKNIIDTIQLVAPILLMLAATIQLTVMVMNPDEKKNGKKLYNKFFAAVIIFFIPVLIDVVLNMMEDNFQVAACWNVAKRSNEIVRTQKLSYYDLYDDSKKTKILLSADKYEKGEKKELGSKRAKQAQENGGGTGTADDGVYGGLQAGDAKGILDGSAKVHQMYEQQRWFYYNSLNQLRWNDIKYSTNNPHKATCCATFVGSAFLIGGVFTEKEINKYNYNSQYGISQLCQEHGWIKISNYNALEAGDIVIMSGPEGGSAPGHVQIYAGNGTWYNAGSTNAIQRKNPYSSDARARFLWAWRIPSGNK